MHCIIEVQVSIDEWWARSTITWGMAQIRPKIHVEAMAQGREERRIFKIIKLNSVKFK